MALNDMYNFMVTRCVLDVLLKLEVNSSYMTSWLIPQNDFTISKN